MAYTYTIKKVYFGILLLFLIIALTEILYHMLFRVRNGVFFWETHKQHAVFNIRPFTKFVNDDRLVTPKKNFTCLIVNDNVYPYQSLKKGAKGWKVEIDANGFRVGTNIYYHQKENIVFLGDSVPFGWGIDGKENVPSKFYNLLQKKFPRSYGVINAAVPSYSLYQSVKRYEYELDKGQFPIKYVVLQIFDPATQFLIWGRKWDKKICWTTKDTLFYSTEIARKDSNNLASLLQRFSFIYYSLIIKKQMFDKEKVLPLPLDINDNEAFTTFERENTTVLEYLYAMLRRKNIGLILIPVNPTKPYDIAEKKLCIVIERLNRILRDFASSHRNVYFFDLVSHFDAIGREGLFIDECCHLSVQGAQKQAQFILEQFQENGLL